MSVGPKSELSPESAGLSGLASGINRSVGMERPDGTEKPNGMEPPDGAERPKNPEDVGLSENTDQNTDNKQ